MVQQPRVSNSRNNCPPWATREAVGTVTERGLYLHERSLDRNHVFKKKKEATTNSQPNRRSGGDK